MYGSEGTDSPVAAKDAPGDGGSESPSGSGGSGSSDASDGDGGDSNVKTGAIVLAVAFVALLGFRRLRRRR
jgi:hypothetical protein